MSLNIIMRMSSNSILRILGLAYPKLAQNFVMMFSFIVRPFKDLKFSFLFLTSGQMDL